MLTHVLPTIQLPPDIEYLSIMQSCWPSDRAVSREEFILKRAHLTRYPALRYVAFSANGYVYRFDPSTGAPMKTSQNIRDWRRSAISAYLG
jgi:hypothetical protein